MPPAKSSAFVHDDSKVMNTILGLLNHKNSTGPKAVVRGELRRLVAAWDDAGRDAGKTLQALPELAPYLRDKSGRPSWSLAFGVGGSGLQFIPEPDVDLREVPSITETEVYKARLWFVRLLFNELRDSLAGPCKWKHCGKYFRLKGNRRTAYCSRPCCQYSAASRCTQRRLQREHADKLQRVQAAMQKWPTARTKDDWKAFVSKQQELKQQELEISRKFLTRAVTKGELTVKGKLTAKGKTFMKEHLQRKAGKAHAQ